MTKNILGRLVLILVCATIIVCSFTIVKAMAKEYRGYIREVTKEYNLIIQKENNEVVVFWLPCSVKRTPTQRLFLVKQVGRDVGVVTTRYNTKVLYLLDLDLVQFLGSLK